MTGPPRDLVGYGRRLPDVGWPDGARVAVGLSFDLDNETGPLRDGSESPALFAQGEYGSRAGLPRILTLLERALRAVATPVSEPTVFDRDPV